MANPQQLTTLAESGMVGVMAVSIIASAMGMLTATATVMPIAAGVPATDAGIKDLTQAFGSDIVTKAVKKVGKDDILLLAEEVERLVIAQMKKMYGEKNAVTGLSAAPPGDLATAREIARRLAGLPPQMHEVVIKAMETPSAPVISTAMLPPESISVNSPGLFTDINTEFGPSLKKVAVIHDAYGWSPIRSIHCRVYFARSVRLSVSPAYD